MPYFKKHNVFFVHIPKTGGVTILNMFGAKNGWWIEDDYIDDNTDYIKTKDYYEWIHAPITLIKKINSDVYNNSYKFSIVRNPYDRLVSEYFWRKKYGVEILVEISKHGHSTKFTDTAKEFIDVKDLDFSQFVEALYKNFKDLKQMPHIYVSHFISQTSFLDKTVQIFKFEEIDECIKFISKKYNLPIPKEKHNPTEHANYRQYYTKYLMKMVYEMYIFDFALLKYNKAN